MSQLESNGEPWLFLLIAENLWSELLNVNPERAAEAEHAEWPRRG